jgi:hypothetical protein
MWRTESGGPYQKQNGGPYQKQNGGPYQKQFAISISLRTRLKHFEATRPEFSLRSFFPGSIQRLFLTQQPPVGQGLLIHEVSRSHTTTHHSR